MGVDHGFMSYYTCPYIQSQERLHLMATKRDMLIETALRLFLRDGYHATGIDRILGEAGVAKMTLYNHFKSKDALIVAALGMRDERWRQTFRATVEGMADTPGGQLLAMFDALGEWFVEPTFTGCAFVKAANEFSDPDHPVHAASAEHYRLLRVYIRDLARDAGAGDPDELADTWLVLIAGAITHAQVTGQKDIAQTARRAGEGLLEAMVGATG